KLITEALANKRPGVRARLHAVWLIARRADAKAVEQLFELATNDAEPRVQAQAIRALSDLADPVLVSHHLDARAGEASLARRLATLGRDPRVQLEVVIALGRLRWADAPGWLRTNITNPDAALAHAAEWTMRRSGNWAAILKLLDEPDTSPWRRIARR